MVTEPLRIALLGCGVVGTGVARLLLAQGERLAARAGRPLALRRVVVRDPEKPRDVVLPAELVTTDPAAALRDPEIDVVVELVGGVDWAREAVLEALRQGKHVVTANKALLAQYGPQVFDTARRHGRAIAFEASVAGGIPIIAALSESLAANQIQSLQGILNGTCNFILTQMSERGQSYADAVAEAQRFGFAEADPTLDVDGSDAAHKLAILVQIAWGVSVPLAAMDRRGIQHVQQTDIRFGQELGYTIKLLAEAWLSVGPERQLAIHVEPTLLRHQAVLAQVRGAYNAIRVVGDYVGDTFFSGPGAGQSPTASSVVADLIDVAVGRAPRTFQALRLWSGAPHGITLRQSATIRSRFYLRLLVADRLGVMAEVTRVLADHRISIASIIQHEASDEQEGGTVSLVIMTHTALSGDFRAAVVALDTLTCVTGPSVYYPVAD